MADFKAIMTLAVAGRSYDEIVASAGCSRRDVVPYTYAGQLLRVRVTSTTVTVLDTGQGPGTYSTIKRIMATIDSDAKRPRTITPAAATRKPAGGADSGAGVGAAVHVRSADHYRRGGQGGQG